MKSGRTRRILGGLLIFFAAPAFFSCRKLSAASGTADGTEEFRVLFVSPEGELPASVKNPAVQIQFSMPVVPLARLGKPSDRSDYVTITPALKGVFRWYGTSLLSFESADAVIPQKEYTVTVSPGAKSVSGSPLSGRNVFHFHTEPLRLLSVIAGYGAVQENRLFPRDEVPAEYASDTAVYFSAPVNPGYITDWLRFTDGASGAALRYSVTECNGNMLRVRISDGLSDNMQVNVTLPAGAAADEGCFPVQEAQTLSFHTLRTFELVSAAPESSRNSRYSNPVRLVFNHALAAGQEAEIAARIRTAPEMEVSAANLEVSGAVVTVHSLPVTFDSTYELTALPGIRDAYGRVTETERSFTITVPDAASYARFRDSGFLMLEAQFEPKLVFERQNLCAGSFYSVESLRGVSRSFQPPAAVTTAMEPSEAVRNRRILEAVELSPFLEKTAAGPRGAVHFSAKAVFSQKVRDASRSYILKEYSSVNDQYIQVTDLGISVRCGYNRAAVLVTRLSTGEPVRDAEVRALFFPYGTKAETVLRGDGGAKSVRTDGGAKSVRTDGAGLAVLEFTDEFASAGTDSSFYIEVTAKDDRAVFSPRGNAVYSGKWNRGSPYSAARTKTVAFLFTDRGLYRPGETVTFRGIDRSLNKGEYSPYCGGYRIEFTDSRWKPAVYGSLTGKTSASGTLWGTWKLPDDLAPGDYQIRYYRDGSDEAERCAVSVQYFERLRFEASASIPALTYYSGDTIRADIRAQYLGGGSLAGTGCKTNWIREPAGFCAEDEKYKDMSFGPVSGYDGRSWLNSSEGTLSADGRGVSEQKTGGEKLKGMAYRYRAEADVTDPGGQTVTASASAVVHPARFYIGVSGIKNLRGFAKKGDTIRFDYILLTPDGQIPSASALPSGRGTLSAELLREDWKEVRQIGVSGRINTRYMREIITESRSERTLKAGSQPEELSVKPEKGGSYILRLSAADRYGCEAVTERRFYVTSSDTVWFSRDYDDEITMTPDKKLYAAGDTAEILIQSALPKGRYLMTVEREGIIEEKVLELDGHTSVLSVPVRKAWLPVVYVTLSSYSVRSGAPENDWGAPDLDKPKGYFGYAALHVDPSPEKFDIAIRTGASGCRPGEEAEISLHAEKDGVPVSGAEITLMAVDRGVIDLIDYHVPDPAGYFYSEENFLDCVEGGDSRRLLIDPVTYEVRNLFGGDAEAAAADKMERRRNFEPTALFVPELVTDRNGDARAVFRLPDSLTAYRITAVGVSGNAFAVSEGELAVSNPVSVRSVMPRGLRTGDECEAGAVITNMTGAPQTVRIAVQVRGGADTDAPQEDGLARLSGRASVSGQAEKEITVPAGATLPLMFRLKAESAGWITAEYTVTSPVLNERISAPLEIERPYVYETVTAAGALGGQQKELSAQERVVFPDSPGGGAVTVRLDASRLGVLKEAVDYVFRCPYGCMEQRSSRILPLVAFGDYLDIFGLESEVPSPERAVQSELRDWAAVQRPDGGFPYWPDGGVSDLAVSVRVGEILALAREKGVLLPRGLDTGKLASYIGSELEKRISRARKDGGGLPYELSYGRYVQQRLGGTVTDSDLDYILENRNARITDFAFAGLAYLEKGRRDRAEAAADRMKNYMSLTVRGVDISGADGDGNGSWLGGSSERYALSLHLLAGLCADDPSGRGADDPSGRSADDPYLPHIVYQLLQIQRAGNGRWRSTAETARALIALDSYIRACRLTGTDFTAEALIGGRKFVSGKFAGAGARPAERTEDFSGRDGGRKLSGTEQTVEIRRNGSGTLYYTVSVSRALTAAEQTARDEGLCVYTEICDAETDAPVTGGRLEAGRLYRQTVYVSSVRDRQFVAVRAPVPAGAEIMNASFVTTGTMPPSGGGGDADDADGPRSVSTLSHGEIYDREMQYFWNQFPKGNQRAEFYFRPVRGGTFQTPGVQAECMYEPEIFGRTDGRVWTIR